MAARGRPPKITRQDVVEAAIGLEGRATMTSVAEQLGVTRAALYHHVRNIEELHALVAGERFVELEVPETADWADMLRQAAADFRSAQLDLGRVQDTGVVTPSVVRWLAAMFDRLRDAGFDPDTAARVLQLMTSLVWVNVRAQLMGDTHEEGDPQLVAFKRTALNVDPAMVELLETTTDPEARFAFDIESVIAAARSRLAH